MKNLAQRIYRLALLLSINTLLTINSVRAEQTLQIVTDRWPPYVIENNDTASGMDVEIISAVFKALSISIEVTLCPWKRCLMTVENQQADAILDASITPERKEFLYFPEEPVSEGVTVFFIKKGQNIPYTGLEDLNKLKAGAVLGYSYCDEIDQSAFAIRATRTKSFEQSLRMLLMDRFDFAIEVDAVGYSIAQSIGVSDQIDIIPNVSFCRGGNYLAFVKKAGYDKLSSEFSQALQAFKTTDQYRQILKKYGLVLQP